jgi:phospholipid-binding lipoprotein MlaA
MTPARPARRLRVLALGLAAVGFALLQGCASAPRANADPRDPWEPFNRQVADFNEGLDAAVVKPVATAYEHITPPLVRTGVGNFFGNISDVWSLVNNVLQLKPVESAETLVRVGVNTILGLGGILDVASEMQIQKHREDFGQTLGYWGVPTGPYMVLPLLGPSTLRDSLALPVDAKGDLVAGLSDVPLRNSLWTLRLVDIRTGLLRAGNLLDAAALDKYSFTRDAYLQRRRGQIREESSERSNPEEERYDLPDVSKTQSASLSPGPQGATAEAKTSP